MVGSKTGEMASTGENYSELMFNDFCSLCEKISTAQKDKKVKILQRYITNYHSTEEGSFYRVLRLLLPLFDRERSAYGIKENVLAKIYIRILCLHPESIDALKLKNFRAPKNAGASAGDFGDVAYWVLRSRCAEGKELTLDQVHQHLDNVALRHAEKKPREVDKELEIMLRKMSAIEQKWLIRIVLKDMRLGLGTGRLLSAYHPDANELYNFTNSLQQVCEKLKDPNLRLHEVEIELFTPCRPMLAERCDVHNITKHFLRHPGPRFIETKLDGERSQLHYADGQFKFFSRNAFEFTDAFGSSSSSGSLTPYLAKQLKLNLKNCILDGEMMPWNTKYKRFGSKGMNLDVKSLRVGDVHQPCYCVFDLLYYNDMVLTNKPLHERLALLDKVFTPCEGIMINTPRCMVNSGEEVLEELNKAIDNLEEGIVVKHPDSVYKPNSRKEDWIKIKPEYTPGAMVELDLLIIGGYYGGGKKRGTISHFLLAVAEPPPTPGGDPEVFDSITRVGSGCTTEELAELGRQLEPHWKRVQPGVVPPCLRWTREKPELWIEPQNSIILQVKASEVVRSDFYETGYTLRFPRIEKVRYDKPWRDCLTTNQFTDIRESAYGSLVGDHITQQSPRVKKRRAPRVEPSVASHFRNVDLDRVEVLTMLLTGKEICVLTGTAELSKKDLECKIVENGGTAVLNPGKTTYCVIAGKEKNVRVKNVCKQGTYDVVRADWLLHSLDAGKLLPWTPADLISSAPATAARLAQHFDKYGDSYFERSTLQSLQEVLDKMEKKDISPAKMARMETLLFNGSSPFSFFRGCVAYFDFHAEIGNDSVITDSPLHPLVFDFEFYSGTISSTINKDVTHIILHSSDLDRLEELICQAQELDEVQLVQHYWLVDCVNASTRLPEQKYCLHHKAD